MIPHGSEARGSGLGPVLLVWAFLAAVTTAPYVRAAVAAPQGRTFVGSFYFVGDFYTYLSFVQQSEDGAFLFRDKFALESHRPALINLEWWLVGKLSAALGRRPLVAYRLFGLAAAFALILALDCWLRASGLPASHRLPALILVCTAGGLGGGQLAFDWRHPSRYLDLATGLFPFVELLANPHFVAGTALLLWSLWTSWRAASAGGHALAILLGATTGLVRPWDFVMLVGIRLLVVAGSEPRRWGALLPLSALCPIALYNFWLFRHPAFATTIRYALPGRLNFVWALGPAALLALLASRAAPADAEARAARAHLVAWAGAGLLVLLIRPGPFPLQFLTGFGIPLLAIGALGLARFRAAVTLAAAVPYSATALAALVFVSRTDPEWYAPGERFQAALALRGLCRPGDVLVAPPDIGLYASGLAACQVPSREGYARIRELYERPDPAPRSAFVDQVCATHLAVPGDPGEDLRAWFGDDGEFRRVARVGRPPQTINLYVRTRPASCSQ